MWNYNRLSNADSKEQSPAFDITNPIPELYFDRLAETEAEAVKRNQTRANAVNSAQSDPETPAGGFFNRVKSAIPGI